jgi:hypothetical protein
MDQLPIKGVVEIIQLVNSLPADPLMFSALQKIKLTECLEFPQNRDECIDKTSRCSSKAVLQSPYLTGTGYHCLLDKSTGAESVYNTGQLCYPTIIGFALPSQIVGERIGKIFNIFKVFRTHDSYITSRVKELKLPTGLPMKGYPKTGCNISHTKSYADIAFTFVREYRLFSLRMESSAELHPDFITRLKEICTYSVDDFFGVKQWEEFFSTHGTHVIQSANVGGRIVLTILENHLKHFFKCEDLCKKEKAIEEVLCKYLDSESEKVEFDIPFISAIKLYGGDTKFEHIDLARCKDTREMKEVIKEWVNSLPYRPTTLDSVFTIESIPDILDRKGFEDEAMLFDNAVKKLIGKSVRNYKRRTPDNQKTTRWGFW